MRTTKPQFTNCPGCGAKVPDVPGIPHKYFGATMGCWEIFGRILAKEYGEYHYPQLTHRLTVDAYAAQHPSSTGRQATQSVNVHLISMYLVLERGFGGKEATDAIRKVLRYANRFEWLTPPQTYGTLTVLDVVKAPTLDEHRKVVEAWARNVWGAWSIHHSSIRNLANQYLK